MRWVLFVILSLSIVPRLHSQNALSIQLYPGLTITGAIGSSYIIQYVTNLSETNWQTLTTLILPSNPHLWMDTSCPATSQRFYRSISAPTTGMVLIPAGPFVMGDPFNDGSPDEKPTHSVYISAFLMDKYLVTKSLWDDVKTWSDVNGYTYDNAGLGKATNHPVHTVNWYDCVKWCNARSQKEGLAPCYYTDENFVTMYKSGQLAFPFVKWNANGYRLPTEAEWEKAARGGQNGRRFPLTNTISHVYANYISSTNYSYDIGPSRGNHPTYSTGGTPYSSPPGAFAANGYGLFDMAGNMYQWCWDWSEQNWYQDPRANQDDTRGPTPSVSGSRVQRGGAWGSYAISLRCAYRWNAIPASPPLIGNHNMVSFRCVRGL